MDFALGSPILQTALTQPEKTGSKIHDAAQQFESLMIGEMLKAVRESSSDGWLGSGDSDSDDSALSMAETQLASAISRAGGLGLAGMIEHNVSHEVDQKLATNLQLSSAAK
jgi:peptidoglycan hydrolase FlgJ